MLLLLLLLLFCPPIDATAAERIDVDAFETQEEDPKDSSSLSNDDILRIISSVCFFCSKSFQQYLTIFFLHKTLSVVACF